MRLKAAAFVVVATLCLVQLVCASPAAARDKREDDDSPASSSEEESAFEKGLGDLFSAIIMASLLTCETMASAANTHCNPLFLPRSQESDKRNHVVASSLMELWEDLRTIEPVQQIYREMVTKFVASKNDDALKSWFEDVDAAMAADPRLAQRYKELKSKYETLVVVEPDHLEKEQRRSSADRQLKFEKDKRIKELRVNLVLASRLNADDDGGEGHETKNCKKLKFRALAKTMVEMSKSVDKYEKLQHIYRESLAEVAANVDLIDSQSEDVAKALYKKLKRKIKADPAIKSEFEQKKKDMLKKLKEKV